MRRAGQKKRVRNKGCECQDNQDDATGPRMEGEKRTGQDGVRAVGREGGRDRLGMRTRKGGQRRVKRAGESSLERVW